ncbi:MAG: hypothetical protein Ct9H300mP27_09170 [Chloroflexota bacterium]|nr:MAG: hypothetical protein Ct9H300mP27_09170 [Chloroflexota bacterium]
MGVIAELGTGSPETLKVGDRVMCHHYRVVAFVKFVLWGMNNYVQRSCHVRRGYRSWR